MQTEKILEKYNKGGFKSSKAFENYVKKAIVLSGDTPIKAVRNSENNCLICGESGRCPGWHTRDDQQYHN